MTALIAWPRFHSEERNCRSINRWQHRLNRERPTGTERQSLIESADGRMATAARQKRGTFVLQKSRRPHLTPTGLLMEGDYTQYKKAPTFAVG